MEEPLRFVVDASVGIQLFVKEAYSDGVHRLFSRLADDPPAQLFVPDLFYIECANILLKYSRRFGRPIQDSLADLADLHRLNLKETPAVDLMEDALLGASEMGLTAYDACYAVLAERLQIPLLSADKVLVSAVKNAKWIGDL